MDIEKVITESVGWLLRAGFLYAAYIITLEFFKKRGFEDKKIIIAYIKMISVIMVITFFALGMASGSSCDEDGMNCSDGLEESMQFDFGATLFVVLTVVCTAAFNESRKFKKKSESSNEYLGQSKESSNFGYDRF